MHPVSFWTLKRRGGELPPWYTEKATVSQRAQAYGAGAATLVYHMTETWDVPTRRQSLLTICYLLGQWVFYHCRVPCVAILILTGKHFSWTAEWHKSHINYFLPTSCMGCTRWLLFPAGPLFGEITSHRLKWSWVSYCSRWMQLYPSQP